MSHRRNGAAMALADVALPIVETEREFDFTDADFRSLVKLAHEHAGISLAESKRNLVYSRLSRRLRALGLRSFHDYRDHLEANGTELESFINAISTNLTKFFRGAASFRAFAHECRRKLCASRGLWGGRAFEGLVGRMLQRRGALYD